MLAVIDGGSERYVNTEDGAIIDFKHSRDPNVPVKYSFTSLGFTLKCNYTWEDVCNPYIVDGYHYRPYRIDPHVLIVDQVYNFSLNIYTTSIFHKKSAFTSQLIYVGSASESEGLGDCHAKGLEVVCIYNCKGKINPQEMVYLRANASDGWRMLRSCEFNWTVTEELKPLEDPIRQEATPNHIFIVKPNTLKSGLTYRFKIKLFQRKIFAVYAIDTTSLTNISCEVNPKTGVPGVTPFKISCVTQLSGGVSMTYLFYDKSKDDEPGFSGRFLGSQQTGTLAGVLLTRGNVVIYQYDEYSTRTEATINVQLSESNFTAADIQQKLNYLSGLDLSSDISNTLGLASLIPEVLKPGMEADKIVEDILSIISQIPLNSLVDCEASMSALRNVLVTAHKHHNLTLSVAATAHASQTLASIAATWHATLSDDILTFSDVYQMVGYLLDSIDVILGNTNEEMMSKPEEYVSPDIYDYATGGSKKLLQSIDCIAHILLHRQLPAQGDKQIVSSLGNTSVWVKIDTPEAISEFTIKQNLSERFPIEVPTRTAKLISQTDDYVGLQFMILKERPLWWKKDVQTDSRAVYICYQRKENTCRYPHKLKSPFLINFDTSHLVTQVKPYSGNVTQLDPDNLEDGDLAMTVIRLDPPARARVIVKFLFEQNSTDLRVLVSRALRPGYEMVKKSGKNMSSKTPIYELTYDSSGDLHFYYMAILPEYNVPVNTSVNFTVRIYYELCKTWTKAAWGTYGCNVGVSDTEGQIVCHCSHLSLFAAQIDTPTAVLSPLQPSTLLLTLRDNPLALLFILLLLIAYLMCCIWAFWRDRKDKLKRLAIVLQDNYPGDSYAYLMCVVTGTRFRAGTDANVCVRLYGDKGESRPHILNCKQRRVLQVMGEDWFLLNSPVSLGPLRSLCIWHDNKGASPAWYCDRIIIYDLRSKSTFHFLVGEWLTLKMNKSPEVVVVAALPKDVMSSQRVFMEETRTGFRMSHLWISALVRHPRDPVTRVDCFTIILCFILVALVSSLGLFYISDSHVEDDPSYSVSGRDIEMSFYSFLVAAVIACLLMILFRKTYSIQYFQEQSDYSEDIRESIIAPDKPKQLKFGGRATLLEVTETPLISSPQFDCWQWMRMKLQRTFIPKALAPLQLPGDPSNIYINRIWFVLTWLVCLVIVVSCCVACVLLGLKMPPVKSHQWLTVAIIAVIIHAFIFLPLRIILVAALSACCFKRLIYTDIYTFDPEDGQLLELKGNEKHLYYLLDLRCMPMYLPIHERLREEARVKRLRSYRWSKVYELLLISVFIAAMCGLLTWNTLHFYTNSHVRSVLASSHKPLSPNFYSVFNRTDFENYLGTTLVENVYKFVWYNLAPLNRVGDTFRRKDWIYDNTLRMLGRIRIRQFRVQPDYCKVPWRLKNISSPCAAPWGSRAEDTHDYMSAWLIQSLFTADQDIYKWPFTEPADDSDCYHCGRMGIWYPPGGYKRDLGTTKTETLVDWEGLMNDWWAGHYTRAVIVQLTVYNPTTRWLTEAVLVAEQTIAGEFLTTAMAHSVESNVHLNPGFITLIIVVFLMLLRMIAMMNHHGLLGYFSRFRRPYELVLLVLAIVSLLFHFLHHFSAPAFISKYLQTGEDGNFDYYKMAHNMLTGRVLLSILFILSVFRFFALWRFGRTYFGFFYTVILSRKAILCIFIIILLYVSVLSRYIAYSLYTSLIVVLNPKLFHRMNYYYLCENNQFSLLKSVSFFVCYMNFIAMALLVCVFTFKYKIAKTFNVREWNSLNLVTFIIHETAAYLKKIRTPKTQCR